MKDKLFKDIEMKRLARRDAAREAGAAASVGGRRGWRFAWRVLSLTLALSLLFNSVSFGIDGTTYRAARAAMEGLSLDGGDYGPVEGEAEIGGDAGYGYDAGLADKTYVYTFETEKTVLLSQIFAMYMLPVPMTDVETVMLLGGGDPADPTDLVQVEPLQDARQQIYDYRITALRSFDGVRLSVPIASTGDVYTLVLSSSLVTADGDAEVAEAEAFDLGGDDEPAEVGNATYAYSLGGASQARLGDIISACGMPIAAGNVEMVALAGGRDSADAPVLIEDLGGDYLITAQENFSDARLLVYTAQDTYALILTDGSGAEPDVLDVQDGDDVFLPEPAEEGVPEEVTLDLGDLDDETPEPGETPVEPDEEPADEPDEPGEEPADEPDEPGEEPADEPGEALTAEPVDEQTIATETEEELTTEPVEEQVTEPVEEQVNEPVEEQVNEPVEEQTTEPVDEQTTEPVEEQVTEPVEEQPVEEQVEPIEGQTEEPVEEQTTEPVDEQTTEPVEEQVTEPVEEQPTEPVEEQDNEPVDEQPTEPVEEQADEPVEEPPTEPIEEQADEPVEEPPTESIEEQADEPVEEPSAYPAQSYAGGTAHVRVQVDAPEGAFPEGTTMEVAPNEDSEVLAGIADAVAEDFVEVKSIYAVDIAFHDAEGAEIEPLLPTAVVMSVDAITEAQRALIVHVNDAGVAEIVEQTAAPQTHGDALDLNMELSGAAQSGGQQPVAEQSAAEQLVAEQPVAEPQVVEQPVAEQLITEQPGVGQTTAEPSVDTQYEAEPFDDAPDEILPEPVDDAVPETETDLSFEADAFSTYAVVIVETVATRRLDASGDTWAVELDYGADAGIPADAALQASEMTGAVAEVFTEQAARVLDVDVDSFTYVKVLDMTIVKDGEALQPQAPVSVSVQLHDIPERVTAEDDLHVVHFSAIPQALDCAIEGETVTFEADGFSAYVIAFRSERQYPAQSFEARAAGVSVSVDAPEGAFPEGATMRVKRVMDRDTVSDIREAVAGDFVEVRRVQLVDIAFYDAEGREIEPLVPVTVSMTVSGMKDEQEAVVVHVDDAGAVNVQSSEVQDTPSGSMDVSFDADAFSMYAVVVTETIQTKYIDAEGNTWFVEVGYGADAGIPSGAALEVRELTGEDAEAYIAQAAEALDAGGVAYAKALDISIVKDGEKIHPSRPVSVSVRLLDAPEAEEDVNVNVLHFGEEVGTVDCALNGDAVEFETDGFSVYVFAYTVDFTYDGYTYNLAGGGELRLSALFEALGIDADLTGSEAWFSDDMPEGLVELSPIEEDGAVADWNIRSLAPFSTEHTLTVRLADGTRYVIGVTDEAIYSGSIVNNSDETIGTWEIDENGDMNLTATGEMKDYTTKDQWVKETPWYNYIKDASSPVKKVIINNGITHVGTNNFTRARNIEIVDATGAADTLVSLGSDVFKMDKISNSSKMWKVDFTGCSKLTSLGVENAFNTATALKEVYFTDCSSLGSIPSQTFYSDTVLEKIDFSGCTALASIGNNAFYNCSGIKYLDISGTQLAASNITTENTGFGKSKSKLLTLKANNCANITSLSLSGFSVLKTVEMKDCTNLTSITFPNSIESIDLVGSNSLNTLNLSGITNLKSLRLPSSITSLNLTGCTGLNSEAGSIYFAGSNLEWQALVQSGSITLPNGFDAENKIEFGRIESNDSSDLLAFIDQETKYRVGTGAETPVATPLTFGADDRDVIMQLHFAEDEIRQMNMSQSMTYALPSGVAIGDANYSGEARNGDVVYGDVTCVNGQLVLTWKEDLSEEIKELSDLSFTIEVPIVITDNRIKSGAVAINFGNDVVLTADMPHNPKIVSDPAPQVVYDPENRTLTYTVVLTALGNVDNNGSQYPVYVNHEDTGSALIFVSGTYTNGGTRNDSFTALPVTLEHVLDGEEITLQTTFRIDPSKIEQSGMNLANMPSALVGTRVALTNPGNTGNTGNIETDDSTGVLMPSGTVTFSDMIKSCDAGEPKMDVMNGATVPCQDVVWTIQANTTDRVGLRGTITDTPDFKGIAAAYIGDGASIVAKNPADNTHVYEQTVTWNRLLDSSGSGWTWTIPEDLRGGEYELEITYTTRFDLRSVGTATDVTNTVSGNTGSATEEATIRPLSALPYLSKRMIAQADGDTPSYTFMVVASGVSTSSLTEGGALVITDMPANAVSPDLWRVSGARLYASENMDAPADEETTVAAASAQIGEDGAITFTAELPESFDPDLYYKLVYTLEPVNANALRVEAVRAGGELSYRYTAEMTSGTSHEGLSAATEFTFAHNPVEKSCTVSEDHKWADYTVTVNRYGLELGSVLALTDVVSDNQAIDESTVSVQGAQVTPAVSGNTLTCSLPDATLVAITYRARLRGLPGGMVNFNNTAALEVGENTFTAACQDSVKLGEEDEPTPPNMRTYHFYISDELVDAYTQTVKSDDEVVVPQPVSTDSKVFTGWYEAYFDNGSHSIVLSDTPYAFDQTAFNENDEVSLYAGYREYAYVVFHDQYDAETGVFPVLATRGAELEGDGEGKSASVEIGDISAVYTGADHLAFWGWSRAKISTPGADKDDEGNDVQGVEPDAQGCLSINETTYLYPIFKPVRWLTYYAAQAGLSAAYVPPQSYFVGEAVPTPLPGTSRAGYSFLGWWTGSLSTETVDGQTVETVIYDTQITNASGALVDGTEWYLTEDTTLYANWAPTYNIVHWKQVPGADPKAYEYAETDTLNTQFGATVSVGESDRKDYPGYTFSHSDPVQATIGNTKAVTVLNAYYDLDGEYQPSGDPHNLRFVGSVIAGTVYKVFEGVSYNTLLNTLDLPNDPTSTRVSATTGEPMYTFEGWFMDQACTIPADPANMTMPDHDLTLYAGWTPVKYKVDIDPNYGALYEIENGEFVGTGKTFFGNTCEDPPIGEYRHVTRDYVKSSSGTYYYAYQGRNYGNPGRAYYTEDPSQATEDTTFARAPGAYTYAGWFEVNADGTEADQPYDFTKSTDHDTRLRLHWKKSGAYYIALDAGEGTLENGARTLVLPEPFADHASLAITQSANPPEDSGMAFVGWRMRGDESGAIYTVDTPFELHAEDARRIGDRDIVYLDAVYALPGARIVYHANGGTVDAAKVRGGAADQAAGTVTFDNLTPHARMNLYTGEGFEHATDGVALVGWKDTSGDNHALGAAYLPASATTDLDAVWNVRVTWHLNSENAEWGSAFNDYDSFGDNRVSFAELGAPMTEPSDSPTYMGGDGLRFGYWSTVSGEDGESYDFAQPVRGALDLYAHWTAPNRVAIHAVDASAEALVEKTSEDAGWTVRALDAQDAWTVLNETTGCVVAPEGYTFGFVAAAKELAGVSADKAVTEIKYDAEDDALLVKDTDGNEATLEPDMKLYFVWFREKTVPVRYCAMAADGALTVVAEEASAVLGEASMANLVRAPLSLVDGDRYRYFAYAVGSADAHDASGLTRMTRISQSDSDRPALTLRNTWRGIEYTADGATGNCGYDAALYVVYFEDLISMVTFSEETAGPADAAFEYRYTTAEGGDAQTVSLKNGEAHSVLLFHDSADAARTVVITQTVKTGFNTKVDGVEGNTYTCETRPGNFKSVSFVNTLAAWPVQIWYVRKDLDGSLAPVGAIGDGSYNITYRDEPLQMNGADVIQGQTLGALRPEFVINQTGNSFHMPPVLDDGECQLYLGYDAIGVGDIGATNVNQLNTGKGRALTLRKDGDALQYSFGDGVWRDLSLEGTPVIYAIYTERGYDLQICKTVDISAVDRQDKTPFTEKEFKVTLTSPGIKKDSYPIKGGDDISIRAVPAKDGNPGSIELTVRHGSRITIEGLGRGDYEVEESGNDNYTLTAEQGDIVGGVPVSIENIENNVSFTVNLGKETRLSLTNTPKPICQVGTHPFHMLCDALDYLEENPLERGKPIEMLTDYVMPATDSVEIKKGFDITLTTSATVYQELGDRSAVISRSEERKDSPLLLNRGSLTLQYITLDGKGDEGLAASASMIQNEGVKLTLGDGATLRNARSSGNGGAVYATAGTIEINEGSALSGNTAANGGAIYYSGSDAIRMTGGALTGNQATADGGAIYAESGRVELLGVIELSGNAAKARGGAIAVGRATVQLGDSENGEECAVTITGNTAANGGAISATLGSVLVCGTAEEVTLSGNIATVNGGAIWIDSGSAEISGGALSGNAATGVGGAIYANKGTITVSGGMLGGDSVRSANTAKNGSAIFVKEGNAEFTDGSVTGNQANGNGGAVGVGSTSARLNFSGSIVIQDNTQDGDSVYQHNVYLDQDTNAIINTAGLSEDAWVGIYVPNKNNKDGVEYLYKNRGNVGAQFGTFTGDNAGNVTLTGRLVNDRQTRLGAIVDQETNRIFWSSPIRIRAYYMDNTALSGALPNGTNGTLKYGPADYYPKASGAPFSTIAEDVRGKCDAITTSMVYATAVLNGEYLKRLDWAATGWEITRLNGEVLQLGQNAEISLYYADPAFISIENNTDFDLSISAMTVGLPNGSVQSVLNKSDATGWGLVFARDGSIQPELLPVDADSNGRLVLSAKGGSISVLIPGGQNRSFSVTGKLMENDAPSTSEATFRLRCNGTETSPKRKDGLSVTGTTLKDTGTYEIILGDDKEICQIPQITDAETGLPRKYTTMRGAVQDAAAHNLEEVTIEMLVDYLMPGTDVVKITKNPDYTRASSEKGPDFIIYTELENLTFTTADTFKKEFGKERATISRGNGNMANPVISVNNDVVEYDRMEFYVNKLNFDGKSLVGACDGGALKINDCKVKIENADFVNFISNNGGGIYISYGTTNGNKYSFNDGYPLEKGEDEEEEYAALTVNNALFSNNESRTTTARCGGGAIWTNAKTMTLQNCRFTDCKASDQGGAVFHRIDSKYNTNQSNYTPFPDVYKDNSKTVIKYCTVTGCVALAGGGIESDAHVVEVSNSTFMGCTTKIEGKQGRGGGAINVYIFDSADTTEESTVTITSCTFTDCSAERDGGGLNSAAKETYITNSTFRNCNTMGNGNTPSYGGGVYVKNKNATVAVISGCTFESCKTEKNTKTNHGGGLACRATELTIDQGTVFKNCTTETYGGGIYYTKSNGICSISDCTIENCGTVNNGGGWYADSVGTVSFTDCIIQNCVSSAGSGGGIHTVGTLSILDSTVSGNKALNQGGGVYCTGNLTLQNAVVTGNELTNATSVRENAAGIYMSDGKTLKIGDEKKAGDPDYSDATEITGNSTADKQQSNLRLPEKDGVNDNKVTIYNSLNVGHVIGVANAKELGTQFGTSPKTTSAWRPTGLADKDAVIQSDEGTLYGIIQREDSSGKKVVWEGPPVCKLTDGSGNLLYFNEKGGDPAIFGKLDDAKADGSRTAVFTMLRATRSKRPKLYVKSGTGYVEYTGNELQIKMLRDHETKTAINAVFADDNLTVTFTTAGKNDADYHYVDSGTRATVTCADEKESLMTVGGDKTLNLTLKNIALNGGDIMRPLVINNANAGVTLANSAVLENGYSRSIGGGGAFLQSGAFTIHGGTVRDCSATNGGGVYQSEGTRFTLKSGSIYRCQAEYGGGVYAGSSESYADDSVSRGFRMLGGTIGHQVNSVYANTATVAGGGVYVADNGMMTMKGGNITNNRATSKDGVNARGGGIAAGSIGANTNARVRFAGDARVIVTGNTSLAAETDMTPAGMPNYKVCNLQLDQDSNEVIQVVGDKALAIGSYIGVYVTGDASGGLYPIHGDREKPFGTFGIKEHKTNLYSFVNDRNRMKGGIIDKNDELKRIYWVEIFEVRVGKQVIKSQSSAIDDDEKFNVRVTLTGEALSSGQPDAWEIDRDAGDYGDMEFNADVDKRKTVALVELGQPFDPDADTGELENTKSGINLSHGLGYAVEEVLTEKQQKKYMAWPLGSFTGSVGENLSNDQVDDPYVSAVKIVNIIPACKITDAAGQLLYREYSVDGSTYYLPAVYTELTGAGGAFSALEANRFWTTEAHDVAYNVATSGAQVQMLIPSYFLLAPVAVPENLKGITLTTAAKGAARFPYQGGDTPAVIRRGFATGSMFKVNGALTLSNITLDGGKEAPTRSDLPQGSAIPESVAAVTEGYKKVSANGGIVNVPSGGSLNIRSGAVLQNSWTQNKGGAVYVASGASVDMIGGKVWKNASSNDGAGIYIEQNGRLSLSGALDFGQSEIKYNEIKPGTGNERKDRTLYNKTNGSNTYKTPRQDIFIAGYEGAGADVDSLVVSGEITAEPGSIWVWAEKAPHYRELMQFAKIDTTESVSDEAMKRSLTAFRNAQDNKTAENETISYLYGITRGDGKVYWNGPMVCKIADTNGKVLYTPDGVEAVYSKLVSAFNKVNEVVSAPKLEFYTDSALTVPYPGVLHIEMLVPLYRMKESAEAASLSALSREVILTTAGRKVDDTYPDMYPFDPNDLSDSDTAVIRREFQKGSMLTTAGKLSLTNVTLDGGSALATPIVAEADGGIVNVTGGTLTIDTGATLCNSSVRAGTSGANPPAGNGGAVYVQAGATVALSGGTISQNAVASAGKGAGIYLEAPSGDRHARLEISGAPSFGGTDVYADGDTLPDGKAVGDIKGTDGNYVSGEAPTGKKNGGKVYEKYRQDIFIAGYGDGETAASLVVTDVLTGEPGSIWVWSELAEHGVRFAQFATFKNYNTRNRVMASERKLGVFRDALDDATSLCSGDYLSGQTGDPTDDEDLNIYWHGYIVFRKVYGNGNPTTGAGFKLVYPSEDGSAPRTDGDGKYVYYSASETISRAVTADNPVYIRVDTGTGDDPVIEDRAICDDSLVVIEKVLPGTYFLEETAKPQVPGSNPARSYVTREDALFKLVLEPNGLYGIYKAEEDAEGAMSWPEDADHRVDLVTLKTPEDEEVEIPTIVNVDQWSRKVILRKVEDGTYDAVKDAEFTVYYADRKTVVSVDGVSLTGLKSRSGGAFFIGKLPYGKYYIEETDVPKEDDTPIYTVPTHYFALEVSEAGVRELRESENDADLIPSTPSEGE